jgi:sulfate transport system substrate-binding protein
VQKLFKNVVSQDSSGRNATNTFLAGKGDVLLTYESEAVAAKQAGQNIAYLVPGRTMLIELPIAPIRSSANLALTKQFIAFTKTAPAQNLLAQYGYRPVLKSVAKKYKSQFPTRGLIAIDNPLFGGWRKVDKRWFDPNNGLMVGIEKSVGGPTG